MKEAHLIELLAKGQFAFMFAFCTVFGVLANESLLRLIKPDRPKWNNMFAKFCLALFVTMLTHGYYDFKQYNPKYEYIPILLVSFLHLEIGSWIRSKLWPLVINSLLNKKTDG